MERRAGGPLETHGLPLHVPSVYASVVRTLSGTLSVALAIGVLATGGCDDGNTHGGVREWRATDHQVPAQPAPDSSAQAALAPPPELVAQQAAALYSDRCASCHGADGVGVEPGAPDLSSAEYQASREDAEIAQAIRVGGGSMPAFGQHFNERGIAALVGHVRRLGARPEALPTDSAPETD